jgi:hypothetical protein
MGDFKPSVYPSVMTDPEDKIQIFTAVKTSNLSTTEFLFNIRDLGNEDIFIIHIYIALAFHAKGFCLFPHINGEVLFSGHFKYRKFTFLYLRNDT